MAADGTTDTPWQRLIGQDAVALFLRSAARGGRLSNGYLFEGPDGVGKRTAAGVFAQVLLCHNPPAPDTACGECKSCHWMNQTGGAAFSHPDLLIPVKRLARQDEVPVGDHEPIVPIDAVQLLCERLHRSPTSGPRRVAIVPEAHRLCRGQAEAANAFLKTLEEPPETSVILLTTSHPEALLDTIISRLQPVRFRRLACKDIEKGLAAKSKDTEDAIRLAANMGDGSLGRALELLQGELNAWRQWMFKSLATFGPKHCPAFGLAMWKLAEEEGKRLFLEEKESGRNVSDEESETEAGEDEAGEEGVQKTEAGWNRYVFGRLLELCEVAFRDGLVKAAGGTEQNLIQKDKLELAEKLANRFGVTGCEQVLASLREARFATRLYIRGDLVGRVLAGNMVQALNSCI